MRGMALGLVVFAAALTGGFIARVVPEAQARSAQGIRAWEYKCHILRKGQDSLRDRRLAERGREGWELVTIAVWTNESDIPEFTYCYKRPGGMIVP